MASEHETAPAPPPAEETTEKVAETTLVAEPAAEGEKVEKPKREPLTPEERAQKKAERLEKRKEQRKAAREAAKEVTSILALLVSIPPQFRPRLVAKPHPQNPRKRKRHLLLLLLLWKPLLRLKEVHPRSRSESCQGASPLPNCARLLRNMALSSGQRFLTKEEFHVFFFFFRLPGVWESLCTTNTMKCAGQLMHCTASTPTQGRRSQLPSNMPRTASVLENWWRKRQGPHFLP